MKKQSNDALSWVAIALVFATLTCLVLVRAEILNRLDALPTVTTTGYGMEARK